MKKRVKWTLVRNFVIELAVYGVLVTLYAVVVLRLLSGPLNRMFHSNLGTYAVLSLGLIVTQGIVLDVITSFLLEWLNLGQQE